MTPRATPPSDKRGQQSINQFLCLKFSSLCSAKSKHNSHLLLTHMAEEPYNFLAAPASDFFPKWLWLRLLVLFFKRLWLQLRFFLRSSGSKGPKTCGSFWLRLQLLSAIRFVEGSLLNAYPENR